MKKVLITGAFKCSSYQIEQIRREVGEVLFMQNESDDLQPEYKNVDMIVCNGLFLYHPLSEFKNLKFVQLTSAGLDRVPIEEIKKRGILLFNAKGVYNIPMAEWAVLKVLEIYKYSNLFAANQYKHKWNKCRTLRELSGKDIGIVGGGNVGQEVAKRFAAFNANCIGYDIYDVKCRYFQRVEKITELKNQISNLDVVVLTVPYTRETHHLMNFELLSIMKQGAVLINIARGGLICEQDLIRVLKQRDDLYVALDVFEVEPLPSNSPLWDMNHVLVSPHNSFVSEGNNDRLFSVIYDNIVNFINTSK